jgi:hypothetical protein
MKLKDHKDMKWKTKQRKKNPNKQNKQQNNPGMDDLEKHKKWRDGSGNKDEYYEINIQKTIVLRN